jgi:hypothetical protein
MTDMLEMMHKVSQLRANWPVDISLAAPSAPRPISWYPCLCPRYVFASVISHANGGVAVTMGCLCALVLILQFMSEHTPVCDCSTSLMLGEALNG